MGVAEAVVQGGVDRGVGDPLRIGQLARRSGLTTKALRHYHRLGLLLPDEVHPAQGDRLYSAAAVRTARLHRFDHLFDEGDPLMALTDTTDVPPADPTDQRRLAADLFNGTWRLIEQEDRTVLEDDRMVHMAHASRYHWEAVGTAANLARGEWICSRVYAILGRGEPSLHHARRVLEICQSEGIGDWDLAFAYEALARARAVGGDLDGARRATEDALAAAEDIAEDEDRALVLGDLETIPGQPRFW